ncbi:MAG: tRNA pseudouridine(55) synthase TruB [Lautropia sp.]|nr:tRNA pseudouridine(55) synthase TruB [Lautropia sp.]
MKIHGLLLLDKPLGLSSNAALQKVRRLLSADKAGHGGTLDPMATGVLPLMFGEACKLAGAALTHDKAYEAVVRFGIRTTTDDVEGEVIRRSALRPSAARLTAALPRFVGRIQQVPPVYSALKVGGKAMYRHAREGAPVQAAPREVRVDAIELLDFDGEQARLSIACGSGTYIRSIARDLGEALECGAHLSGLRRTRVGQYQVKDAVPLDSLLAVGPEAALKHLHGLCRLVDGWPRAELDAEQAQCFFQGQAVVAAVSASMPRATTAGPAVSPAQDRVAVLHAGRLAGLARPVPLPDGGVQLLPVRVMLPD